MVPTTVKTTTSSTPAYSVVLPTFNRAYSIGSSIRSVLAQAFRDFELIVVDDDSQDETRSVVHSFDDTRIRYVRSSEHRGAAAARNLGVERARADFIAFIDSDDLWLPQKLSCHHACAAVLANDMVVTYSRSFSDDGVKRLSTPARGIHRGESVADYLLRHSGEMQMITIVAPAKLLRHVRFDEGLNRFEDWDLLIRLDQIGANFVFLPEPLTIYNRDHRTDRVSLVPDPDPSHHWLEKHRDTLTPEAAIAFEARCIAPYVAAAGERLEAAAMLVRAFRSSALPAFELIKLASSIFLPNAVQAPLKSLYGRLSLRRLGSESSTPPCRASDT